MDVGGKGGVSVNHQIILECDDLDYDAIQKEIALRQARSRAIAPNSPTILPDGDSNLAGAIVAEMCRDLNDYRDLMRNQK